MILFSLGCGLAATSSLAATADAERTLDFSYGLSLGAAYSDNIAYSTTPDSDYLGYLGAKVMLSRQLGTHKLTGIADGFFTQHQEYEQEELDDYLLSAQWDYQPNQQTKASLTFSYADETYHRLILSHPDSDERAEVESLVMASGNLSHKIDDWRLFASAQRREMDFRDVTRKGAEINRDDEDRYESDLSLGVERSFANGGMDASFSLDYKNIDYKKTTDDDGLVRSADVYIARLGLALNGNSGYKGKISIGSYYRDFEGDDFDNLRSYVGNAHLKKTLSKSTDLTVSLFRSFNEFNLAFSPGYYASGVMLGAGYKFGAKNKLNGSASYIGYDFIDDTDDIRDVILSAHYTRQLASEFNLMLKYTYIDRESESVVFNSFDESRIELVLNYGALTPSLSAREWFYWVGLGNTPN